MDLKIFFGKIGLDACGLVVISSVLIGLVISVLPIPLWATPYWPEWVLLVVVYWCIALPDRYNIGFAWLCGLATDLLRGHIMGQHALAYIVVVAMALLLHRNFRLYPVVQQALIIGLLLIPYFLLELWINHFLYPVDWLWHYWLPWLTSMVVWVWIFSVLRLLRQKMTRHP